MNWPPTLSVPIQTFLLRFNTSLYPQSSLISLLLSLGWWTQIQSKCHVDQWKVKLWILHWCRISWSLTWWKFQITGKVPKTENESLKELGQSIVEEKIGKDDDSGWEAFKENGLNKGLRENWWSPWSFLQWFSWSSQK